MTRRLPLDGVRAIAVLAVMAHHFDPRLSGGFLGVDVFFVLSGYLITSLLVEEARAAGHASLPHFYARRALRLLPALVPLFALVAILFPLRPDPAALGEVGTMLAVMLYVGNWVLALTREGLGYFTHTWSLAIEEQFYLLWPLALPFALRRWSLGGIAVRLLPLVALVGLWRAGGWLLTGADAFMFTTVTRADGLLLGCALAFARQGAPDLGIWRAARHPAAGGFALAVLGVSLVVDSTHESLAYLGGVSIAVLAAATLIAHVELAPLSLLGRVLTTWPLPALGKISYGLYLFHYPVGVFLYQPPEERTAVTMAAKIALSIGLAVGSYLAVERPALQLKKRFSPRRAVASPA